MLTLLAFTIVLQPRLYTPPIEAQQDVCQSYYKPLLHSMQRAWPNSDGMAPVEREKLYTDINEMLRTLSREKRLLIKCEWEARK